MITSIRTTTINHRTIRKNTIYLLLSQLNGAVSYVYTLIIARLRGPEFLGGLNFGLTLIAMVGMVASLGIANLLVREISAHKDKAQSIISTAFIVLLISTSLVVLSFNAVLGQIEKDLTLRICLRILSLSLFLDCYNQVATASFMAIERMSLILIRTVTWNVLRIISTLIVLYLGFGITSIVIVWVASTAMGTILNYLLFRRYVGAFSIQTDKTTMRYFIVRSPIFLSLTISVTLSWQLDTIMLKYLGTLASVGLYTSAYKMYEALMQIPQAYLKSCFPELSRRYHSGNIDNFILLNKRMLKITILYVFAIVGLVWAGSDIIVSILGSKFAPAASLLRVLVLGLIPWSIARNLAYGLVAADLQRLDLIANVVATIVNATLNAILIPIHGALGAAAATAVSLTFFFVMEYLFSRRIIKNSGFLKWLFYGAGISLGTWGIIRGAILWPVWALAVLFSALTFLGLFYWRNNRFRKWVTDRIGRRLMGEGNHPENQEKRIPWYKKKVSKWH